MLPEAAAVLKDTFREFLEDSALRHGAALSYYATISLAPLLLLLLALAGLIFDRTAVADALVDQMRGLMGESGAEVAGNVIANAQQSGGALQAVTGFVVLLFGASGVFVQLQESMNTIWEVKPSPRQGLWGFLRKRLLSFGIVLSLGFLLLISLAVSAGLAALNRRYIEPLPGAAVLWHALYLVVSIAVFTLLFAALFKYLPDVSIFWRDVWWGALVTALLFTIGKFLIGMYLGRTTIAAAYGAAGSLVLLLVWIYYSSLIVLLGAEFTQVLARRSKMTSRPESIRKRSMRNPRMASTSVPNISHGQRSSGQC
jgi:membrane protein